MLHYITGFANSGKSNVAEKLVAKLPGPTTYIATLPNLPYYKNTILLHQQSRPRTWGLSELIGDLYSDFNTVQNVLDSYQNILFDGLSFYLLRLSMISSDDFSLQCVKFKELISSERKINNNIIVVDPPVNKDIPMPLCKILRDAHFLIIKNSDVITFVHQNKLFTITEKTAISLDYTSIKNSVDFRIVHLLKNN